MNLECRNMDLSRLVGENQKRLRTEQGMSLDALAKASGVSKSRLSQIERGEANPSISTVWQIANALSTEFTALIAGPKTDSMTTSLTAVEPLTGDHGRLRTFPLFPYDPAFGFEFYASQLDAGGHMDAEPHSPGSEETVLVTAGALTIDVAGVAHLLAVGNAIRFRADQPHGYRNDGDEPAEFTMVVAYRKKG